MVNTVTISLIEYEDFRKINDNFQKELDRRCQELEAAHDKNLKELNTLRETVNAMPEHINNVIKIHTEQNRKRLEECKADMWKLASILHRHRRLKRGDRREMSDIMIRWYTYK